MNDKHITGQREMRGSAVLPVWMTALSLLDERMLTSVVTPRAVNSTESASMITRDSTIIYDRHQTVLINDATPVFYEVEAEASL